MNQLTAKEVDQQVADAIRRELLKGFRPKEIRVFWNGMEWGYSAQTKRWELKKDHHPERPGNLVEVPR